MTNRWIKEQINDLTNEIINKCPVLLKPLSCFNCQFTDSGSAWHALEFMISKTRIQISRFCEQESFKTVDCVLIKNRIIKNGLKICYFLDKKIDRRVVPKTERNRINLIMIKFNILKSLTSVSRTIILYSLLFDLMDKRLIKSALLKSSLASSSSTSTSRRYLFKVMQLQIPDTSPNALANSLANSKNFSDLSIFDIWRQVTTYFWFSTLIPNHIHPTWRRIEMLPRGVICEKLL